MRDYVYAPKDDPKHRHDWREPYDADELAGFERFAAEGAPRARLRHLARAVDRLRRRPTTAPPSPPRSTRWSAVGARPRGARPRRHPLRRRAAGRGPRPPHDLAARPPRRPRRPRRSIPTEYVGMRSTPHLDALAAGVPADVPIGWTGRAVVNDAITVADAEARADVARRAAAAALGQLPGQRRGDGRPPLRRAAPRPRAGPRRRVLRLPGQPDGAARASTLPLASIAALPARRRPRRRCGARPRPTSAGSPSPAPATATRRDARRGAAATAPRPARCSPTPPCARRPGLEDEAGRWLTQVHRDARLALTALDVLDGERGVDTILGMGVRWQASRRSPVTVFGPRCSVRVRHRPGRRRHLAGRARRHRARPERHRRLVRQALDSLQTELRRDGSPVAGAARGRRSERSRRRSEHR